MDVTTRGYCGDPNDRVNDDSDPPDVRRRGQGQYLGACARWRGRRSRCSSASPSHCAWPPWTACPKSSQVVPVLSNWITTLCAVTLTAAIPILSSCRSVSDRKTGLAGCCRSPPLERVVSLSLSFSASLAAFALRWSSIALAPSVPIYGGRITFCKAVVATGATGFDFFICSLGS